jgi:hypothetical protein
MQIVQSMENPNTVGRIQKGDCQMVLFHAKSPNLGVFWKAFYVGIFYDHLE